MLWMHLCYFHTLGQSKRFSSRAFVGNLWEFCLTLVRLHRRHTTTFYANIQATHEMIKVSLRLAKEHKTDTRTDAFKPLSFLFLSSRRCISALWLTCKVIVFYVASRWSQTILLQWGCKPCKQGFAHSRKLVDKLSQLCFAEVGWVCLSSKSFIDFGHLPGSCLWIFYLSQLYLPWLCASRL